MPVITKLITDQVNNINRKYQTIYMAQIIINTTIMPKQ